MGGQHRPYTRQFKEQAVKLVIEGQEPTRTARELGMPHSTLMTWLKKAGWRKPEPQGAVISEDPAVLKTQIKELQRQLSLPVSLIDGEMTSWYGPRAITGLRYLAKFSASL